MPENVHYRLIVKRGPQPNQIFELTSDTITLGRDIINDITISDPEVSRHHCQLVRNKDGGYTLQELGSTNGTFIKGERITGTYELDSGDSIMFGETVEVQYTVTKISVPQQASELGSQETVPVEPVSGVAADPKTATTTMSTTTGVSSPAKSAAPPAYVYKPSENTSVTPEARRVSMLACGVLTIVCLIGSFMGIILIDASDSWNSVPLVGGLFESAPVDMERISVRGYSVDVPEDWNYALTDFSDISQVMVSSGDITPDSFESAFDQLDFTQVENVSTVLIVYVDNSGIDLSTEEMLSRALSNSLADGYVPNTDDYESIEVDDFEGDVVTINGDENNDFVAYASAIEVDDNILFFMGYHNDGNNDESLEIFEHMLESVDFTED